MKQLVNIERFCLIGHLVAMAFGLAGILLVMPHPEFLSIVPAGQTLYRWSMAGGGVIYILLGTIAVAIHAYRTLGFRNWLTFMVPAIGISLSSELLGTSTGFPFGHYSYLSGLGYKIADLVPFTIPLSWFYLGFSSYLLARAGLAAVNASRMLGWLWHGVAITLGALLLTSWDFVLDPAMSQTALPFWYWHQPGAFFGMPYQNFAGWMGTGMVFMTVAALFWRKQSIVLHPSQLALPLVVYLSNFVFATIMSVAAGFWIPPLLGLLLGVAPAVLCWKLAHAHSVEPSLHSSSSFLTTEEGKSVNTQTAPVIVTSK
ncbi:MAG: carotenoid biosynthesis protein [Cyanobacteria bacterium CRU_2_1]|nr:carotenoid biosynthesis protein [Cyanobacteria bacterium RU_5_0]NJR61321.1 carotenoid biosynthesis protein [Cyanobacteria bacterium CRU_2_1]